MPNILLDPGKLRDKILNAKLRIDAKPTIVTRATPNEKEDTSRKIFTDAKFSQGEQQDIPTKFGRFDGSLASFKLKVEISDQAVFSQLSDVLNSLLPQLPVPAPALGLIYVLMERDSSAKGTIAAAHKALNEEVTKVLNGIGAEISASQGITLKQFDSDPEVIRDKVVKKAKEAALRRLDISSAINKDDTLGTGMHVFSSLELARKPQIIDRFSPGKRGVWEVRGQAQVLLG